MIAVMASNSETLLCLARGSCSSDAGYRNVGSEIVSYRDQ
jgi:hypothetical protein